MLKLYLISGGTNNPEANACAKLSGIMHEVSVVEEIVEALRGEMKNYPGSRLQSVSLKIGKLRQFVPEMMEFSYGVAINEDPVLGESKLVIEEIPIRIRCRDCAIEKEVEDYDFHCPICSSANVEMITGNELLLEALEITEPADIKG